MNDDTRIILGLQEEGIKRSLIENELYTRFFYFTTSFAKKYRLTEEEIASVYSDTIITVIRNVCGQVFKGESGLKTYVFRIFSNKCVDVIRKKTTNKNSANTDWKELSPKMAFLPENVRNVLEQMILDENKELIRQKFKELGEKCQQILLLFEDDHKDQQIAEILGYNSADVAKTSRLRCFEKLKELISGKKVI